MNAYKFVTLIVVSVLVTILLASALNNLTRVTDSALADNSLLLQGGGRGGDGGSNAPRTSPGKNYLPIIFLNSATAGGAWLLAGNAGTNPASDFLGTTDKVTLTIRVSNTVAFRIAPAVDPTFGFAPNIIGGYGGNTVAPGVWGATIAGGGVTGLGNSVGAASDYAFIGGGYRNTASSYDATIGGGYFNTASGYQATIGGGADNLASGFVATIGGGTANTASNTYSTVAGGALNTANGNASFVGGGGYDGTTLKGNQAAGNASTIAGGWGNTIPVTGTYATIGGGALNTASNSYATVSGGYQNTSAGYIASVGGGVLNNASGVVANIGGGQGNAASGSLSTVGGGFGNTASNQYASIGGGDGNTASGIGAFIGGGGTDGTIFVGNVAGANASTISGGYGNVISSTGFYAVIGGGVGNTASNSLATIGGGASNTASNQFATVGGGINNTASNSSASVGGGQDNIASGAASTVGGGDGNTANGTLATVGGGVFNTASGYYATIPGGVLNSATMTITFAAGYQAHALHQGAFVWADSTGTPISSTAPNQFLVHASGGVGINTNVPSRTLDVNGVVGLFDNSTRTYDAGVSTEVNSQLINIGINDDSFNRFGGAYSSTVQGGLLRVDTRGAYDLFQFLGRPAGSVSGVTQLASLNSAGKFSAVGGFNGQCLSSGVFSTTVSNSCNMDVAEGFASTELTEPGDLVALVTSQGVLSNAPTVRKSSNAYDELLIGVVSQNPGLVFDNGQTHLSGDNSQLITNDKTVVALVGRVNVKVSTENGVINIGDPLTSSSQPGIAMKATQAGKIIGYAMANADADGMILALVQAGDYVPPAQLDALKQNGQLETRLTTLEQSQSLFSNVSLAWGVALLAVGLVIGRRRNKH